MKPLVPGILRVPLQPVRLLRGYRLDQRDGADQDAGDATARHLRTALCTVAKSL